MRTTEPSESSPDRRPVRLPIGADELAPWLDAPWPDEAASTTETRSGAGERAGRPAGRILRLRLGMNPNSSSVGTNVVTFMWTLSACGAVLGLAGAILAARMSAGAGAEGAAPAPESPGLDGEGAVAEAAS